MKNFIKKYWIYITIAFVVLIVGIGLFIILKDDDKKTSSSNYNPKLEIYDIDEEIYVIEEDEEEYEDLEEENVEDYEDKEVTHKPGMNNNTNSNKEDSSKNDDKKDNVVKPNITVTENDKYTCPSGYELINDKCYKSYRAKIEYKCAYGTLAGAYCVIDESTMANATYTCPSDYKLEGQKCVKSVVARTYNSADYEHLSATVQSSYYNNFLNFCSGTNMYRVDKNGIDYCYEKKYTNPTITYDCNGKEGTLAGNGCIHHTYVEATEFPSCPDGGYLEDRYTCRVSIKATKK